MFGLRNVAAEFDKYCRRILKSLQSVSIIGMNFYIMYVPPSLVLINKTFLGNILKWNCKDTAQTA